MRCETVVRAQIGTRVPTPGTAKEEPMKPLQPQPSES